MEFIEIIGIAFNANRSCLGGIGPTEPADATARRGRPPPDRSIGAASAARPGAECGQGDLDVAPAPVSERQTGAAVLRHGQAFPFDEIPDNCCINFCAVSGEVHTSRIARRCSAVSLTTAATADCCKTRLL
jgi:hypothetical protein